MRTVSTSSSPAEERLVRVPLERLHPHPANPNVMTEEQLATLARNMGETGHYLPLAVRPHPGRPGEYELLDGEQRREARRRNGHSDALCYVIECDDRTALLLLGTLNRLRGEDVPARRAELLAGLRELMPVEELALLLPEDASEIDALLSLLSLDSEQLLADLTEATERTGNGLRSISFAVGAEDEKAIEEAVRGVAGRLDGRNRRGRALGLVCHAYLEGRE